MRLVSLIICISFFSNGFLNAQICIDFEDDTGQVIPFTQANDGELIYSSQGIDIYGQYIPNNDQGDAGDIIYIHDDYFDLWTFAISNFMSFGYTAGLIDLSGLNMVNKEISFRAHAKFIQFSNVFEVNGFDHTALPSDIDLSVAVYGSYSIISLSGPINTVSIGGWEVGFDDFCVSDGTLTNIESTVISNSIKIQPNPTISKFSLGDARLQNATIEIYNALGQTVDFNREGSSFELIDPKTGLYLVMVQSDKVDKILKLQIIN